MVKYNEKKNEKKEKKGMWCSERSSEPAMLCWYANYEHYDI